MAAKFELYKDKKGEFRWRLRHQNGNIIADSGEGYVTKANALNGINSVQTNCVEAPIKELAPKEPAKAVKAPPAPAKVTEPEAPPAPAKVTEAKAPPAPARVAEAGKGQAILTKLLMAMVILLIIFGILLATNVGSRQVWIWVESVLGVLTVGIGLGLAIRKLYW